MYRSRLGSEERGVVHEVVDLEAVDGGDLRASALELEGQVVADEAGAADEGHALVGQGGHANVSLTVWTIRSASASVTCGAHGKASERVLILVAFGQDPGA